MYVKIVEYIDAKGVFPKRGCGDLVVPTRNHLFESERVEYKKVRVTSQKELHDALLGIEEYSVIGYLPTFCDCDQKVGEKRNSSCDVCHGNPECLCSFEFIVICINDSNYIVNGELFIMNEHGKTIDSLVCH